VTPEQRIAARLRGIANMILYRLEPIERRQRWIRPTTPDDIEREERRRATSWRQRQP
jgi:hypothetical protein